ncbi:MAG: hypothetical protein ACR2OD_02785 [Gaiellaceae bacterium]
MALQNRVCPDGELVAVMARGSLMGNRGGRLHDPVSRTLATRRWASKQWISCTLTFKGRHRTVWGQSYTELFFLDEATALAAGHRPCYECRRRDAHAFADAIADRDGLERRPTAGELDQRLHAERLDGRAKRLHVCSFAALPGGAIVLHDGQPRAVLGDQLVRWTHGGYTDGIVRPHKGNARVLTPPTALAALVAGYEPAEGGLLAPRQDRPE